MLKADTKLLAQFIYFAEPFTGIDCITDSVDPFVGRTKVFIAGQNGEIEEFGLPTVGSGKKTK